MRKCVISLATPDRNYQAGLATIQNGLTATGFDGDFLSFTDYPPGCPSHRQAPYGFKAFITEEALAAGYSQVLYLDSSAVILRSLQPIFDVIETRGYFLHSNDDCIGAWCKDEVLQGLGVGRASLRHVVCHLGGIMGLRTDSTTARRFLNEFKRRALDGYSLTFAGSDYDKYWAANRTDARQLGHRQQAVTSLIAHELGMVPFCEGLVSDAYIWERPIGRSQLPADVLVWFDRVPVQGTDSANGNLSCQISKRRETWKASLRHLFFRRMGFALLRPTADSTSQDLRDIILEAYKEARGGRH